MTGSSLPSDSSESGTAPAEATAGRQFECWELPSLLALLTVLAGLGLVLAFEGAPLGHDEAAYATRSRYYATGANADGLGYWNDYRAEGLPWLLGATWWLGGTDVSMRIVMIALALVTVAVTWAWARHLFGPRTAIVAAVLLAAAPGFFRYTFLLLPEVPATAAGVGATLVFAYACRGERVSRGAYFTVPLAIAATFVRYGAPAVVGSGLAVVALANWGAVRQSMTRTGIIATTIVAAVGAILFVPQVTGSSTAPALAFRHRQTIKDVSAFSSYADLLELTPGLLGWVVGPLVILGVVLAVQAARSGAVPTRPLLITAGILLLFTAMLNAAVARLELRYLTPALPWLLPIPAVGLVRAWDRFRHLWSKRLLAVAVTGLAVTLAFRGGLDTVQRYNRNFAQIRIAAQELDGVAAQPCLVFAGLSAQFVWYSGCARLSYPRFASDTAATTPESIGAALVLRIWRFAPQMSPDATIYAIYIEKDKNQPRVDRRMAIERLAVERVVTVGQPNDGKRQHVRIEMLGSWRDLREKLSQSASR